MLSYISKIYLLVTTKLSKLNIWACGEETWGINTVYASDSVYNTLTFIFETSMNPSWYVSILRVHPLVNKSDNLS